MEQTLTEVDQIAMFATKLDQLLCGIEEETVRTVAIHVFLQLIEGNETIDMPRLSAEIGYSRKVISDALYVLTVAKKIKRIGDSKPRRYRLTNGRESIPELIQLARISNKSI